MRFINLSMAGFLSDHTKKTISFQIHSTKTSKKENSFERQVNNTKRGEKIEKQKCKSAGKLSNYCQVQEKCNRTGKEANAAKRGKNCKKGWKTGNCSKWYQEREKRVTAWLVPSAVKSHPPNFFHYCYSYTWLSKTVRLYNSKSSWTSLSLPFLKLFSVEYGSSMLSKRLLGREEWLDDSNPDMCTGKWEWNEIQKQQIVRSGLN